MKFNLSVCFLIICDLASSTIWIIWLAKWKFDAFKISRLKIWQNQTFAKFLSLGKMLINFLLYGEFVVKDARAFHKGLI